MLIIEPGQVTLYVGPDAANASASRVDLLIGLAEGIIAPLISVDDYSDARVVAIALEVVARPLRNPGGYIEESLDDWRGRLPDHAARAGVFLLSDEVETLGGLHDAEPKRPVRSIRLDPYA